MEIVHDEAGGRFLTETDGLRSLLQYQMLPGGVMHIVRTWVAPELRGGGLGVRLVEAALDHARARGYRVSTSCWFAAEVLEHSPEYRDLSGR